MTGEGREAASNGSVENPRLQEIRSEFSGREFCRHLALFYESTETRVAVVSAFVENELERGRRVLYLCDENARSDVETALSAGGVDVDRRTAADDLLIEDTGATYLGGGLDPEEKIATLERAAERAVEAGYCGLSVTGENAWCFHADVAFDHVIEFEARFDERVPDLPITALCQYDLDRFDQRSIAKALWTHEQIVYRNRICENPYYLPPGEYRRSADDALDARLVLEQAYGLSSAHRDVERREQRLSVLNRVLRHDVRNELNVVLGNLSEALESEEMAGPERSRIDVARRHAENVIETAEKARYVEQTLTSDDPEPVDLRERVEAAVERARDRFPDAHISVSGARRPTVLADRNVAAAVEELLHNAIRHQQNGAPEVAVSLDDRGTHVALEVHNPGHRIPKDDRRALETGRETALDHASGLGLWMVKWITENSNGTLSFPDRDGESVTRIELPKAER